MIFQIASIIDSPTIRYFNNGAIFPAGTYIVRYSGRGAMQYGAGNYRINAGSPTSSCFFIVAESELYHTPAPGLNTDYGTEALAEAANVGQQVVLNLSTPSQVGIWLDDSIYTDNTFDTETPIFEIDADVPPFDPDSTYKNLILSDQPLIYYRHGESELATAFDSSGNNHHGSYVGDAQLQQTSIINDSSGAVYLNNNAYVDIPIAPLQNLNAVTVEGWFVWDDEQPDQRIFDFNNGVVGLNEGMYFFCSVYHHSSGLCRAAVTVNGLNSDVSVDSIPIIRNRKYYAAVTLGEGKLAIFVNGQKIQETDTNITLADLGITQAWLAKSPWPVDSTFRGTRDETAIYDRILSDSEILEHYNTGISADTSNIKDVNVDDNIIFSQTVTYFQEHSGGGNVYSFTISDSLNFADGTSGPPTSYTLKDTLFFIDNTNYSIFPTRMIFKDQLIFVEDSHGSPFRITVKDTLLFNETFRHNQHPESILDTLLFVDIPDPHWFEEFQFDNLVFDETFWGQNNHQYWTDNLVFTEAFNGRFSIKNESPMDVLTFNEAAVLRWSIANITIIDTLEFVEEFHRILEEDIADILVFVDFPLHVFPEDILDDLDFDETIDYTSSKGFFDKLTLVEVFCVESSLSRAVEDLLVFRQYAAFLINGSDDPRNGGGNNGPGGGVSIRATYRRTMLDRLVFKETVESDPAPDGKDCVVEVN